MSRAYYAEYLRSQHWQETRVGALERAEHRCQLCNRDERLQVHHRTYENLGGERPADIIVLCDSCHSHFHDGRSVAPRTKRKPKPKHRVMERVVINNDDQHRRVLGVIEARPTHAFTAAEIASLLGWTTARVGGSISRLKHQKLIKKDHRRDGRSTWRLRRAPTPSTDALIAEVKAGFGVPHPADAFLDALEAEIRMAA